MTAPDAQRWERIQEILADALELEGEARVRYLDGTCGDDPALRDEVDSLLRASEEADAYFTDLADRAGMTQDAAGAAALRGRRSRTCRAAASARTGSARSWGGVAWARCTQPSARTASSN